MPNTIEEYIASCPEAHRARLREVYGVIREAAPQLKEKISWGMPTFYGRHNVIHFALHKSHVGIYPGAEAMVAFEEKLQPYKRSKGAFQTPLSQPLPGELIADITRWSAERNG